jgi:hypothetical protein
VIGVQVSLVVATGVHVSGVPAMGSHFSMAELDNVSAMVEVELPSKTRATDVVKDKDKAKFTAPTTSNTPLALVVKLGDIVACALNCGLTPTVIVDEIAIVAVLCSMLSFLP